MTNKITGLSSVTAVLSSSIVLFVTTILAPFTNPLIAVPTFAIPYCVAGELEFAANTDSTNYIEYPKFIPTQEPALAELTAVDSGTIKDTIAATAVAKASVVSFTYRANAEIHEERITPRVVSSVKAVSSASAALAAVGAYPALGYAPSEEEVQMMYYIVDGEARGKSLEHRIIVAEVILNRVLNPRFPNTIREVLTSPGQFDPIAGFFEDTDYVVNDVTREAVDSVLQNRAEDYAQGALYFCNPTIATEASWFENALTFLLELEGHRFYK